MQKRILLLLCLGARLAGAQTAVNLSPPQPAGHWAITHQVPVDQNKNGRIERNEWKQPGNAQPWNRPQLLEGQTRRWNVRWETGSPTVPSKPVKL